MDIKINIKPTKVVDVPPKSNNSPIVIATAPAVDFGRTALYLNTAPTVKVASTKTVLTMAYSFRKPQVHSAENQVVAAKVEASTNRGAVDQGRLNFKD